MSRALVPEAAIDEHRHPRARKGNIDPAADRLHSTMVDPEAQTPPMELAPERKLRTGVPAAVGAHCRARGRGRGGWGVWCAGAHGDT